MKIDPYKHKERYFSWKEKAMKDGIPGSSETNSKIILQYLSDMEHGINVSLKSVKGARGYPRLNTLREKMLFFTRRFKELYDLDNITEVSEEQLLLLFSKMRKGEIFKKGGQRYLSVNYFVKSFKSFWHWWQTSNKKKGVDVQDITIDLDSRGEKPKWVYLTEEQVRKLCNKAKYEYRVLIMFLFDTGIRAPTELINLKVSDLYNDCKELQIRDEISKTFGRKIKLMLSSDLLRQYIADRELKESDHLFLIKPATVNLYLKRLTVRVLGDGMSLAGQRYSEITMYDFRHISCCYWLPRYKSESALKYRFGWKKSDKVHYYSELLGMKDTIQEEDLFIDNTKTELEREQIRLSKENDILKEKMDVMGSQMKEIFGLVKEMVEKTKV